jgi:hypothetical protein
MKLINFLLSFSAAALASAFALACAAAFASAAAFGMPPQESFHTELQRKLEMSCMDIKKSPVRY